MGLLQIALNCQLSMIGDALVRPSLCQISEEGQERAML